MSEWDIVGTSSLSAYTGITTSSLDKPKEDEDEWKVVGTSSIQDIVKEQSIPKESSGFLRGLGLGTRATAKGVASPLTMASDAVGAAINLGIDAANKLFRSKVPRLMPTIQALEQGLTAAGLPKAENSRERLISDIVQGGAAGAAFPSAAATIAGRASGIAGNVARTMAEMPVRQTISGVTSGLSSGIAREAGAGPVGQTVAGVVGALAPSAVPNRAVQSIAGSLPGKGPQVAGVRTSPYENSMAVRGAARKLAGVRAGAGSELAPEIYQNRLNSSTLEDAIDGLRLNEAARSGDPGTIAALRSSQSRDAQVLARIDELQNTNALGSYIAKNIKGEGNQASVLDRVKQVETDIANLRAQNVESVEKVLGTLEPANSLDALGFNLRETLTGMRDIARGKMSAIWGTIDKSTKVNAAPIETKINDIFGGYDAYYSQLKTIPNAILESAEKGLTKSKPTSPKLYGPNDKLLPAKTGPASMTLQELADFNTTITSNIRAANASGNSSLARNLHEVKNGIEEVITNAASAGGTEAGKLKKFWDIYREEYAPRFNRGQTAEVLRKGKGGDYAVRDVDVAGKYFLPGAKGIEAAKDFAKTFGDNPVAKKLVQDYAAEDMLRYLRKSGNELPKAQDLQRWKATRADALKAYGIEEMFDDLETALNAAGSASARESVMNKAVFSKLAGASADEVAGKIMSSAVRDTNMRALVTEIKKSPEATAGLKSAIGDWFESKIQAFRQTAQDGTNTLNVRAAEKFVSEHRKALSMVYSPEEMKAFNYVTAALKKMSLERSPGKVVGSATHELMSNSLDFISNYAPLNVKFRVFRAVVKKLAEPYKAAVDDIVLGAMYNPERAQRLYMLANDLKTIQKPPGEIIKNFIDRQLAFQTGMMAYRQEGQ